MRLALLSDIHGNPIALDAVLADIQAQGEIDAYWVLGDFSGIGYDPVTPLQKIVALPNVRFVRGNTDRYLMTGDNPIARERVLEKHDLFSQFIEGTQGFAWARGYITSAGWFDWFTKLELEQRLTLPDGTRLLGVHASPGRDDGPGLQPKLSDEKLEKMLAGCKADLIVAGHTHIPMEGRNVAGMHLFNLGSISNPVTPQLQATYAILEATTTSYTIQLRRVDYDRAAVIKAIHQSHYPFPNFLISFMQGERVIPPNPGWMTRESSK